VPDPGPDVIEFSSATAEPAATNRVRSRLVIAGAAAAVVVIAAVVVLVGVKPGATTAGGAAGHANPALARLISQVTGVPVSTSDAAGSGGSQNVVGPDRVTGTNPPLVADGKPEVLFVGEEFCPYCATESWALIVALSRFGTFTGLSTIRSDRYGVYPPLATWTFYGSAFTSKYLDFVSVETRSDVLVSRKDNPQSTSSYTRLQKLTTAQQAIFTRYDKLKSVPFLDIGNKYVLVGSSFEPVVLEHQTWSQIAAALRNPRSPIGQAILGTANYITTAICALTGDQPATACTPAVKSLLGRLPAAAPGAMSLFPVGT
jgi:Domain of unknown function (DUF929)